jgi:hypothetical protein
MLKNCLFGTYRAPATIYLPVHKGLPGSRQPLVCFQNVQEWLRIILSGANVSRHRVVPVVMWFSHSFNILIQHPTLSRFLDIATLSDTMRRDPDPLLEA